MPRKKTSTQAATHLDIQALLDNTPKQAEGTPADNPIGIVGIDNEDNASTSETVETNDQQNQTDNDAEKPKTESIPEEKQQDSGTDSNTDNSSDNVQDDDLDDGKTFNNAQMKAILDRKTKQLNTRISELEEKLADAESKISEAEKNGMIQGKIEQRKNEVAKRYGFERDILPDTEKGLDNFEKQMAKYEKGHEKRSIPVTQVKREDFKLPWIKSVS